MLPQVLRHGPALSVSHELCRKAAASLVLPHTYTGPRLPSQPPDRVSPRPHSHLRGQSPDADGSVRRVRSSSYRLLRTDWIATRPRAGALRSRRVPAASPPSAHANTEIALPARLARRCS